MSSLKITPLLFVLALCAFLWGNSLVSSAQTYAPDEVTWQISIIDSADDVGRGVSLALKPGTNTPYISYQDKTHWDLKLAFPVVAGGDCGPGNTWSCNSLAYQNTEDYGFDTAIAFTSQGQWGIAYSNFTNQENAFRGLPKVGTTELFGSPIDQPSFSQIFSNSMLYDSTDTSNVSYGLYSYNEAKAYLKYALYVGNYGNCANGKWNCETVTEVHPALFKLYNDLFLFNVYPAIFYRDTNQHLSLAIRNGSNYGEFVPWHSWVIDSSSIIDSQISGAYFFDGEPHLMAVYVNGDYHQLRFARNNDRGEDTCGTNMSPWLCENIENVGATTSMDLFIGTSLSVWNGSPLIAYTDLNDTDHAILKLAYPVPEGEGNCGAYFQWQCDVIDDGNGNDVGYYPSLQIGTDGRIHIAYYDATAGDLKYAVSSAPIGPTPTPTASPTPSATPPARNFLPLITH